MQLDSFPQITVLEAELRDTTEGKSMSNGQSKQAQVAIECVLIDTPFESFRLLDGFFVFHKSFGG